MKNTAIIFEEATKDTYTKWRQSEEQKSNAEKNIEIAIVQAISENSYIGFTRTNNARQKVMNIEKEGIIYSLLYNMVQLSSYRQQRINYSLGKIDAIVTYVTESIKNGNINGLENMLVTGVNYINKKISPNELSDYDKVALELAQDTLTAYAWYNTSYKTVSPKNEITHPYYKEIIAKLDANYYEHLQMKYNYNNQSRK